jgi:N-acetylneuraminic acid mutarotase
MGVDSTRDYILDIRTLEWTPIERVDKNAPKSIDEHTATLVGEQIYIFGGNIAGFKNDQMFVFDPSSQNWTKLEHSSGPCARSSHSAVLYQERIYVFGGKDIDGNKLNDLWEYDIKNNSWKEIQKHEDAPLSRSGHSACTFKNFMIVFGGIHELTQELNDMLAYDFNNKQWFSLIEESLSPTHSAAVTYGYSPGRKSFSKSVTAMSVTKQPPSNGRYNDFSVINIS